MTAFKIPGFTVFAYTVYAIIQGGICTKSGAGVDIVSNGQPPDVFWLNVAI